MDHKVLEDFPVSLALSLSLETSSEEAVYRPSRQITVLIYALLPKELGWYFDVGRGLNVEERYESYLGCKTFDSCCEDCSGLKFGTR
jgi:hypothetical protein